MRLFTLSLVLLWAGAGYAARLDPELQGFLDGVDADQPIGVIVTFHDAPDTAALAELESLGLDGIAMQRLPMVAVNAHAGQIQALLDRADVRSIYRNRPLDFFLHQSRKTIGVDAMETDSALTSGNGGRPISGRGVVVAVVDSGVDATHPDLELDLLNPSRAKTIENVQVTMNDEDGLIVRPHSTGPTPLKGIILPVYAEKQPNTDTHIGHGTHVAGIVAGTGEASGALYRGVAPGAQILGLGSGYGLFIVGAVASFDYILVNQPFMNIRAVNNSWGNAAVPPDPDHPINVATKELTDHNIAVLMAAGNDGPIPNSQNRFGSLPHTFNIGASTKDGRLANFSSRGIFGHPTIHPLLIVPGDGGPASMDYTSAIVAARSRSNLVANGLDADTELPPNHIPNYTQIIGTSMATPHAAGMVANLVEVDPSLTVEAIADILTRTATPLAVYDRFEAGAGLGNMHAAADLAMNPDKPYGALGYAGKGLDLSETGVQTFSGVLAEGAVDTHAFHIPANARFTFVQLDWGAAFGEDEIVFDNTQAVANDLALDVRQDGGSIASSDGINLAGLFGAREGVKIEFPRSGQASAEISAGLFRTVGDQPYTVTVRHYLFDPAAIADLEEIPGQHDALRLVYDRVMHLEGNRFEANAALSRMDLAMALMPAARVPQYLNDAPVFSDLSTDPDRLYGESMRRAGIFALTGSLFDPNGAVDRELFAVALTRSLGLEDDARALAGTTVTFEGQALYDNAAIAPEHRGHVQLALDLGLLEAFPTEFAEISPGVFRIVPGPRFEPATVVSRGAAIEPFTQLIGAMYGEN